MAQRIYTPDELEALRLAADNKFLWGSYGGPRPGGEISRMYQAGEKSGAVEQMVRDLMSAGHTAEELRANEEWESRP